jgi:hypothetical protein
MKKQNEVILFLLCLTVVFFFTLLRSVHAADKVVVIPLGASGNKSWTDGVGKVTTTDDVGIGVATPAAKLDVNGGIKIADDNSTCDVSKAGLIRWENSIFEGCNGTNWITLSPVPTVYSSGHEWMDRNLGAEQVAESPNDPLAFGDLYQWGRFRDGHEKRGSSTTTTRSTNDDPGHGDFILTGELDTDWRTPSNDNLWQASGINNPCPTGFRLPTVEEWNTEMQSWSSQDTAGAFASPLKLVTAGIRNSDGVVADTGEAGYYWTSDGETVVDGITGNASATALSLFFDNNDALFPSISRKPAVSVRCIKD